MSMAFPDQAGKPKAAAGELLYRPFWLVWSRQIGVVGDECATEAEAITQAERSARQNPNNSFIVLQAQHARQATDMLRVRLHAAADTHL